ncbi:DNA-binding MarR family transcriptional regulator [Catalinimonas alkaloidigena]|uniref:MarR family winged helix-turn-helix transcriptional regulator n=1 Tax=Catalinimonas alkaloidigena TaxID=1075417 RepID=UPI002405E3A7|nr:MarR family transcriptional regulator [Catalinimonas alkaloidigena]MDF9798498.1 DNA-binding MarR family transcriptional regulator [Catalinimonas alkaloidigena]
MKLEEEIKQRKFSSEKHKVIINLMYTGNWVYSINKSILKQYNISPEQYNVLRILRGQYPDPSTVMLLNERMLDKMSNVSRIVEKLRVKNLLTRKECPADRRQVDITITREGLALLKQIDRDASISEQAAKNLSTEEAAQLNELLDKVRG